MDTLLKPARLDLGPNSPTATKEWRHWYRTFTNFIDECGEKTPNEYRTLVNYVSHNVYEYIKDCKDYKSAISVLEQLFVKTPNEIFARHLLATRRQKSGETLAEFPQELRKLSKDCNFKNVTAEQYREELVRDFLSTVFYHLWSANDSWRTSNSTSKLLLIKHIRWIWLRRIPKRIGWPKCPQLQLCPVL